jgi:hypothetical protein
VAKHCLTNAVHNKVVPNDHCNSVADHNGNQLVTKLLGHHSCAKRILDWKELRCPYTMNHIFVIAIHAPKARQLAGHKYDPKLHDSASKNKPHKNVVANPGLTPFIAKVEHNGRGNVDYWYPVTKKRVLDS